MFLSRFSKTENKLQFTNTAKSHMTMETYEEKKLQIRIGIKNITY